MVSRKYFYLIIKIYLHTFIWFNVLVSKLMMGYSTHLRALKLEPHHSMQFIVISRTPSAENSVGQTSEQTKLKFRNMQLLILYKTKIQSQMSKVCRNDYVDQASLSQKVISCVCLGGIISFFLSFYFYFCFQMIGRWRFDLIGCGYCQRNEPLKHFPNNNQTFLQKNCARNRNKESHFKCL